MTNTIQTSEKKPFKLRHYLVGENPTKEDIRTIILAAVLAPIVLLLSTKILVNIGEKSWIGILRTLLLIILSIEAAAITTAFSTKSCQKFYHKKSIFTHLLVIFVHCIPIALFSLLGGEIPETAVMLYLMISISGSIMLFLKMKSPAIAIPISLFLLFLCIVIISEFTWGYGWLPTIYLFRIVVIFSSDFDLFDREAAENHYPGLEKFSDMAVIIISIILFPIIVNEMLLLKFSVSFVGLNLVFFVILFLSIDLSASAIACSRPSFQIWAFGEIKWIAPLFCLFHLLHILFIDLLYSISDAFYGIIHSSHRSLLTGLIAILVLTITIYFRYQNKKSCSFVLITNLCLIASNSAVYTNGPRWLLNLYIIKLIFCFGSGFRLKNK